MPPVIKTPAEGRNTIGRFALLLGILVALLFYRSFLPGYVHFSNDGPLGMQMAEWSRPPMAFFGAWFDLCWIGSNSASFPLGVVSLLDLILGPVGFAKFLPPAAMFIIGLCAWTFLKRLKLSPLACTLGGFAAAFNGTFLGTACWGVAGQIIGFAADYLALAMVVSNTPATPRWLRWVRLILAGLAVGLGVVEGADNGAIFSMFVAAFVFCKSLIEDEGSTIKNISRGVGRVVVIALFAGLIATQNISGLIGTAIQGVAGAKQDEKTKQGQWDWATQWSFPKIETLGIFMPGIFGYRMNTPSYMPESLQSAYEGGNYWGMVGSDPSWQRYFRFVSSEKFHGGEIVRIAPPNSPNAGMTSVLNGDAELTIGTNIISAAGLTEESLARAIQAQTGYGPVKVTVQVPSAMARFSGGGNYCGVFVCLVALWAIGQSLRRKESVFTLTQRRFIWFWAVAALLALFTSYGRFGPFNGSPYRLLYMLPYFSTIRNPCKFGAVFSWALIVLFGYGIHGLSRRYLEIASTSAASPLTILKSWWAKARDFDRKWIIGCVVVIAASIVGWAVYANNRSNLAAYLHLIQFSDDPERDLAHQIAAFSVRQVGWFILFLALSSVGLAMSFSGAFSGHRRKWGGVFLGFVLVADLGRAGLPYVVHWNYKQKYEVGTLNPIISFLKDRRYEQRVARLAEPLFETLPEAALFGDVYRIEWSQQLFPYYNILQLDIIQNPRPTADFIAYESALTPRSNEQLYLIRRRWALTSTRYLLGAMVRPLPVDRDTSGKIVYKNLSTLDFLDHFLDSDQHRFQVVKRFEIALKPSVEHFSQYEQLTAVEDPNGRYALFEFTGALPHVSLYSHWQVMTNNETALETLASQDFSPQQTVIVHKQLAVPSAPTTNQNAGDVKFVSYHPTDIVFDAHADTDCVLLLNDHYDPMWRVFVDGRPAELLRCNYIMRGVLLSPGEHKVEFLFRVSMTPAYVTLSAMILGIVLSGVMIYSERRMASQEQADPSGKTSSNKSSRTPSK